MPAARVSLTAPPIFSPNNDGRNDTTRLHFELPDVQFTHPDSEFHTYIALTNTQTLDYITHYFTNPNQIGIHEWNGFLHDGRFVEDGQYIFQVDVQEVLAQQLPGNYQFLVVMQS